MPKYHVLKPTTIVLYVYLGGTYQLIEKNLVSKEELKLIK